MSVSEQRAALATIRSDLVTALYEFENARDALREAKRRGDVTAAQTAFTEAENAFVAAREADANAVATLLGELQAWVPETLSPDDDLLRISADSPIVLFPVRIETRFEPGFLDVRVFPDEILVSSHETALTPEEQDRAKEYYEELVSGTKEEDLWRDLIARFGVQRSAYILREMLPTFGTPTDGSSSSPYVNFCDGSLPTSGGEDLTFPTDLDPTDVKTRASSWTRPAEAVLPDRWVVYVYKDGVRRATPTVGKAILEPLPMTADPKLRQEELVPFNGDYPIDPKIQWTIDFNAAVDIGMGIRVPLEAGDEVNGFTRVLVVGVKTSLGAVETSEYLERLFDAHHYTTGIACVRQGTPTNNMEGQPTVYPLKENAGEISFPIEREHPPLDRKHAHHCLGEGKDGTHLAMMLGVPSGVFGNVDRGREEEIERAKLMNRVLWPGTFGFFMKYLLTGMFDDATIDRAFDYFRSFVLARGTAPVFRVGANPYGVLPISVLDDTWAFPTLSTLPSSEQAHQKTEQGMFDALRNLLEVWKESTSLVPRLSPGQPNPDVDMATVLSTYPSSRQFRVRYGVGIPVQGLFYQLFGWDLSEQVTAMDQQSNDSFSIYGISGFPPLGRMQFNERTQLFVGHIVEANPTEVVDAAPGFITNIGFSSIPDLNAQVGAPDTPNLLYKVLRHSTLLAHFREYEKSLPDTTPRLKLFEIFGLLGQPETPAPQFTPDFESFFGDTDHQNALLKLGRASGMEIERLFTETLDLTSHRLDPWITAFAYRRLLKLRQKQLNSRLAPQGDYLGAYGWVEDVKPNNREIQPVDGVGNCEVQFDSGGFIHAPSMTHASAAAVLRSGHLSVRGEAGAVAGAYAVDLSSRRVRAGRRLFEGVRNGQPVGALLGYDLERRLHDLELDDLRFALRSVFPLVANKGGQDGDEPAEGIAARNVVDGSQLLTAHQSGTIPWGTSGLPGVTDTLADTLRFELDRLAESFDASADLLTAESIFQLVRGNMDAAVPSINNLIDGTDPPDTVFSRSARGGIGIAHRVVLVFPSDEPPELPGEDDDEWPDATPRANAEPVLNAWLGELIGRPTQVRAKLEYFDAEDAVIPSSGGASSVLIDLSDLGLHPLDLLALAEAIVRSNQASILDRRIVAAGLADPDRGPSSEPASFKVSYDDVGDARRFTEVIEILNAAGTVFGASRALDLPDLLSPAELDEAIEEEESAAKTNAIAFQSRASEARDALETALNELDGSSASQRREKLVAAAAFLPHTAFPDPTAEDAALADQARAVVKELRRRLRATPSPLGTGSTNTAAKLVENATRMLKGTFGDAFLALPSVLPPRAEEVKRSLEARDTLLADQDEAPDRYLQQIMRARSRLDRYRKLNVYARTSGLARPRVDVVQLPHVPDERWLGLPFEDPETPPEEGRVAALLLSYVDELHTSVPWSGIVIDDWTEIVPNRTETTGVAFNYEGPRTKAPQAVLVAVPSGLGSDWVMDQLVRSLEQTMDLMKARLVDRELIGQGQTLPTGVFATNENRLNVISTTFDGLIDVVDSEGLS